MYKLLDLFSGIGGFSLGLERSGGFRTVGFCEITPYCRTVLYKHWPKTPCADDITARDFTHGEADVICGGFPCQDISLAGDGAGLAGERSGLWRELLRAIRVVRPRYAIVENVAALLGRGMGSVLGDLATVGYDAEWHCIPASAVGAPHRRDRVWIIANPGSKQHEGNRPPISGEIAAQLLAAHAIGVDGGSRRSGRPDPGGQGKPESVWALQDAPDANGEGLERQREITSGIGEKFRNPSDGRWWLTEPAVGRVANGVPSRVDRLRALGNAVVPQIPELIGRAILESEGR